MLLAQSVRRAEERGGLRGRSSSADGLLKHHHVSVYALGSIPVSSKNRSISVGSISTVATLDDLAQDEVREKSVSPVSIPTVAAEDDFTHDEVRAKSVSAGSIPAVPAEDDFTQGEARVKAAGLARDMKEGTKRVHAAAENTQFMLDLVKGKIPESEYASFLCQLYYVYEALEKHLERLPKQWKHFDLEELRRVPAIVADLQHFGAVTALADFHSPSTQQYVDHLEQLSRENPLLLLSHAYTRYLGDLSGGQILAREIAKAYGLSEAGPGTAFYRFEELQTSLKHAKVQYRLSMDALELSTEQKDALVHEAKVAFVLNVALMEERDVAAGHIQTARNLTELRELCDTKMSPLQMQAAYRGVCPFLSKGGRGNENAGHGQGRESESRCPFSLMLTQPWVCLSSLAQVGAAILLLAFTGRFTGGGCPFAKQLS
jgi:heme oxygenase